MKGAFWKLQSFHTKLTAYLKCVVAFVHTEPVKLYDPPVTDIDAIARSVEYVLQHRKSISKNMNLVDIDIDVVARKYLNFLGWTYSGDEYLVSKAS